jgi:hypothetical protein
MLNQFSRQRNGTKALWVRRTRREERPTSPPDITLAKTLLYINSEYFCLNSRRWFVLCLIYIFALCWFCYPEIGTSSVGWVCVGVIPKDGRTVPYRNVAVNKKRRRVMPKNN